MPTPPFLDVGELIGRRKQAGSRPGHRADGARLALVIEGGSSRGAFSHGMAATLEEFELLDCFDAVYGSSAGALNAAWLLCGRAVPGLRAWRPSVIRRVIAPRRAFTGGPVVDTRYLVETVYERVVPMDFPAILASPVTFHPLGTDAETGESVDLHPYLTDVPAVKQALRASTCLPILVGRPVRVGERLFVDAGVAESVPLRTAFAQGATHALVLRTRRHDETVRAASAITRRVVSRYLSRHAPGAVQPWLDRVRRHAAEEALGQSAAVLQIRPPAGAPIVGSLERDHGVLRAAIEAGRSAAVAALTAYVAGAVSA
jgi:predicted patatin/cPLA2 family phospholipase